jgi:hypothetical protein
MQPQRKTALGLMVVLDAIAVVIVFRSLLHHGAPMMRVIIPVVALFVLSGLIAVFVFKKTSA